MLSERASGVLLHICSLPSRGGVGDLGPAAYAFADFLAAAGQQFWQVLPLTPTGYGNSPYSSLSAFAGNPLFISLEKLAERGWLTKDQVRDLLPASAAIDYPAAVAQKLPLLQTAADAFLSAADDQARYYFGEFCGRNQGWLTPYARFMVLRERFPGVEWASWPRELALCEPDAIARFDAEHARAIERQQVIQFFFEEQWRELRAYCAGRGIGFIGDMAIFVNYDSADVWTHAALFQLDEQGRPDRVAGVPPDYFSPTGQRWGNPLYRWDVMLERNFAWWTERIRRAFALCDQVRLDHFRGFEAYWSIPASEATAINGQWMKAPGRELFARLRQEFGELPLIAEDLGVITPEVEELRTSFGLPGMRVMQFGFSDPGAHLHLPHRLVENMVIYTGTHDNNTTLGWYRQTTGPEREAVHAYLGAAEEQAVVRAMIRAAETSVGRLCLIPLQDILGLGAEARMNTPAEADGNWSWRYAPDALQPALAEQLRALCVVTDRQPPAQFR
jgi:4-alpha-glucanotransferase